MNLSPLSAPLHAVLPGLPFTIAEKPDAGAVREQVERAIGAAIRDLNT